MIGEKIKYEKGKIEVPGNPSVLFIEGDGTGPDIWGATKTVLDAAVEKAYGGKRKINWMEILAGEKDFRPPPGEGWARETGRPRPHLGFQRDLTPIRGGGERPLNRC